MKSRIYTGKVSGMKTSPWLSSEDLLGLGDAVVEIAGVHKNEDVEMDGGRVEKCLFSISFTTIKKQMILNATNRKALTAAYGADTKKWIGGNITLTVKQVQKPGARKGVMTTGLRIITGAGGKVRDLNAEMGLSESATESPALQATKPATPEPDEIPGEVVDFEEEESNDGND